MTRARVAAATLAAAVLLAAPAAPAHEVRPALLALRETAPAHWDVAWHVPARGGEPLPLAVVLPEACVALAPPRAETQPGAHVVRWPVRCAGGLAGRALSVAGLERTVSEVLVRIAHADGRTQTARLLPARPTLVVEPAPARAAVARAYLALGVEHVLGGADHLLFVLALLLLVEGRRRLVRAITAFTAAHSLTLAAATLGWLHLPPAPTEATIALSVAFLAREILRPPDGLARRRPWIAAFGFGLLHGLGFAGALAETGLPAGAIPEALVFFNAGVEAGQLLFVAAVLLGLRGLRRAAGAFGVARPAPRAASFVTRVAAYGIGAIATCWTIERVLGFWS